MNPPLSPLTKTLRDGTVVEVFVLADGATSLRVVKPDGTEVVGDFTETDSDLWSEVERRRAAA